MKKFFLIIFTLNVLHKRGKLLQNSLSPRVQEVNQDKEYGPRKT